MPEATWKPYHGEHTTNERAELPESAFAFPKQRKEPMLDANHVRNALARFDQVEDVTEAEVALARKNIKKAARHFDVEVDEEKLKD